jgi:hypothetical protein
LPVAEQHLALHEKYLTDLRDAQKVAEEWWRKLVAAEPGKNLDEKTASAKKRWPDGAPSHPLVIGVFQQYLRKCDELNREFDRQQKVSLNRFAIDWLDSEESDDVSDFMQLTYWPMGDDEEGNLV